jgi:glyoxylase-like metal-dependent hydrolase (beta-lactamase superfamily II)
VRSKLSVTTVSAAVPRQAKGPSIPKDGYLVEEIGDGLFWVTDGLYQMMFAVSEGGVVAVDAPPTLGGNILHAIRTVSQHRVTHAVYSHYHADHVGAMSLYEGAELYAHERTASELARRQDPHRPAPGKIFQETMILNVANFTLELAYHGPNHCPGNTFIYLPAHQVLMLVDVIFPGWVPFAYLAVAQDIPGYVDVPNITLNYPFTTFVGGHLTRLGTREDIAEHKAYIEDLRSACASALDDFDISSVFAQVDPENPWAVFRGYLDGVSGEAAAAVATRWRGRLGGVDAFTNTHAFAMAESLRIDHGYLGPFGIHD